MVGNNQPFALDFAIIKFQEFSKKRARLELIDIHVILDIVNYSSYTYQSYWHQLLILETSIFTILVLIHITPYHSKYETNIFLYHSTNWWLSLIKTQKTTMDFLGGTAKLFRPRPGCLGQALGQGGESPAGKARRGKPGGDSCPENVRKRMSNRCASHILSVNLLQFVGKRRFENRNMVENENVG